MWKKNAYNEHNSTSQADHGQVNSQIFCVDFTLTAIQFNCDYGLIGKNLSANRWL